MPGRRWIILAILFAARAATGFQFQSVGSSAPMQTSTLALMFFASRGSGVPRPEWKPTIALTSPPLRPISSAVVPPKQ